MKTKKKEIFIKSCRKVWWHINMRWAAVIVNVFFNYISNLISISLQLISFPEVKLCLNSVRVDNKEMEIISFGSRNGGGAGVFKSRFNLFIHEKYKAFSIQKFKNSTSVRIWIFGENIIFISSSEILPYFRFRYIEVRKKKFRGYQIFTMKRKKLNCSLL